MLRLKAFGVPVVEGPDGQPVEGAARQRRVLGLLAVVAAGRTRGVTRDRVLGLLWSESEAERARQALTQSLYHTRRALGADDVFLAASELRLNPAVITCDVNEFEDALDAGELDRAVQLYQGPYLDGFYVNGAPEFERWASAERGRLRGRYVQALEDLATRASVAADHSAAVQWRRRLVTLDPLNSRITLELMRELAAAGDRAGAIRQAQVHEALLREELNAAPNPAIVELAEELRQTPTWHPPRIAREAAAENAGVASHGARTVADTPNDTSRTSPARPRAWLVASIAAVVLAIISTVLFVRRPAASRAATRENVTVVTPFRVSGADPALAYLREGLVDLLVAKLIDDSESPAVDAGAVMTAWRRAGFADRVDVPQSEALRLARQLGGTRLLLGSVVGTPSSLVVNATLLGLPDGSLRAQASAGGSADSLTAILDRLVSRLLAKEAGEWERLANRTSTSVLALRAYLDGQSAYRRGAYRDAIRHFRTALERDASFAMAGLALTNAAERVGSNDDRARGLAAAWAARGELTMRDSVYLAAIVGPQYPGTSSAREQLSAWERAAAVIPERADVWHELGERLFFDGRMLSVGDWAARAIAAFRRSAELDPGFASPLQYLVQLSATRGDSAGVRQSAAAYLAIDSVGDLAPFVRWRAATARSDSATVQRLRARFTGWPAASLRALALSSQYNGIGLGDAERALSALMTRAARGPDRADVLLARHALALNTGAFSDALDAIESLEQDYTRADLALRTRVLDALYGGTDSAEASAALPRLARSPSAPNSAAAARELPSPNERDNACVVAQWRAWSDHPTVGRESLAAGSAGTVDRRLSQPCAALVAAIVAVRTGSPLAGRSVAVADSQLLAVDGGDSFLEYASLAVARLHAISADTARALAAVRRRPNMRPWPQYLAPGLLLEARLAAATRDSAGAVAALRHYLILRRGSDRRLAEEIDEARALWARLTGTASTY